MNKILFLEDQPDKNFIINVFRKLLSKEEIEELKESENDIEAMSKALSKNPILEIVSDFTDALKRLENNIQQYNLLIIDRDLYDNGMKYNPQNLPSNIKPKFTDKYHRREGDYLIGYAKNKDFDIDNCFYIFTGNTDEIINSPELELIISDSFKANNILIKGTNGTEKLKSLIDDFEHLDLIKQNATYLNIIRKRFGKESKARDNFLSILKAKDLDDFQNIKESLTNLRNLLEAICKKAAQKTSFSERGNLSVRSFFQYINNYNRSKRERTYKHNSSAVIHKSFDLIYSIASDFGSHETITKSSQYTPTINTVNACISALKDILVWFDALY